VNADVIVVGAGLAGLAATHELTAAGKRVALVDQESAANLGGQAFWSFGGLFLVDTPEQRRLGVHDSFDLAWQDWQGSAQFDRLLSSSGEDVWAVKWARAYVEFAAGEKRSWLSSLGMSWLPTVGWAERGSLRADSHGNSVPRFHVTWGTGTGVVAPFVASVKRAAEAGLVTFHHRHRVDELVVAAGAISGVRGKVLATDTGARGVASNRDEIRIATALLAVQLGIDVPATREQKAVHVRELRLRRRHLHRVRAGSLDGPAVRGVVIHAPSRACRDRDPRSLAVGQPPTASSSFSIAASSSGEPWTFGPLNQFLAERNQ